MAYILRNKDARGTPSSTNGGSFASHSRAESSTGLIGERQVIGSGTKAEVSNFLSAHYNSERWSVTRERREEALAFDADDLAQDALLAVLETGRNRSKNLIDSSGYVNTAVQNLALDKMSPHNKSNRAPAKIMDAKISAEEQRLGRTLTRLETEKIGARIADSWPDQKHRPSRNFWVRNRRIEESVDLAKMSEDFVPESTYLQGSELDDGNHYGRVMLEMEDNGAKPSDMNFLRYVALAEQLNAPMPIPGSLTRRRIKANREIVSENGGVVVCAQAHLDGTLSENVSDALFSPFGRMSQQNSASSQDETRQIANALLFSAKISEKMWVSALTFASVNAWERVENAIRHD